MMGVPSPFVPPRGSWRTPAAAPVKGCSSQPATVSLRRSLALAVRHGRKPGAKSSFGPAGISGGDVTRVADPVCAGFFVERLGRHVQTVVGPDNGGTFNGAPSVSSGVGAMTARSARSSAQFGLALVADLGKAGSDPTNREIAHAAGVKDEGQISKLLARLQRHGLLQNTGGGQGQGAPNEWRLTPAGQKLEQGLRERAREHEVQAA